MGTRRRGVGDVDRSRGRAAWAPLLRVRISGWDRAARVYDLQLALELPALAAALDLASIGPAERVLDLGTGSGALLRLLAARPAPPADAVGVDASPAMLAAARPLPTGWRLYCADARSLPFPGRAFDVVTAAYLLHLLDPRSRREVLDEVSRVLRPGGRLLAVTVAAPGAGLLAPLFGVLSRAAGGSTGPLAGMRALDVRPELLDAGFIVTGVKRVRRGYPSLVVLARSAR